MERISIMGTGNRLALCILLAAGVVSLGASGSRSGQATGNHNGSAGNTVPSKIDIARNLLHAPMSFEVNAGQTDSRVKFLSRGSGYTLFLTPSEAVLSLNSANVKPAPQGEKRTGFGSNPGNPLSVGSLDRTPQPVAEVTPRDAGTQDVLRMQLLGANAAPRVVGLDENGAKSNYYIGNDPSKWRTNVSNYSRVHYADVYPGVDLVFYGNQRQLEYDFIVAPGADARVITLGFPRAGVASKSAASKNIPLHISSDGDLIAHLSGGDVSFHKPVVYQTVGTGKNQVKQPVDGRYILKADGRAGFELGAYDHNKELVIDPTVSFATYLGGSDEDLAVGIAADRYTDVVIAGSTRSADFPVDQPFENYHPGTCGTLACRDVFVSKFNPTGTTLQLSTYIGGSNDDVATQLVLDMAGDMFVVGWTLSTDFPITPKAFQKTFGGGTVTGDGFVFELASKSGPAGGIEYASYLGGSGEDVAYGISVDYTPSATPNVYVVGSTTSPNFPTTTGAYQRTCGLTAQGTCANAFASKVNPKGTALVFSTYLGGSGGLGDAGYGVAVDPSNNVYVSGMTGSPNFPTTAGAFQTSCGTDGLCNGTFDGFVTELNNVGKAILASTFLGGSGYDYAAGIALDKTGAIYVSGNTTSSDFPTTASAAQTTFGGMSAGCSPTTGQTCGDVTVTKFNPSLETLAYSTYLGGSLDENPGLSMAVDANGNAYVTGQTDSTNFPLVLPFQPAYGGGSSDAFVTIVNPAGTAFTSSSYLGGNGQDFGYRVALDTLGDIYVSGGTVSTNFPVKPGVFQTICGTDGNCNGGLSDAWAAKLVATADVAVTATGAPNPVLTGANLTYTIVVRNNGPDTAAAVSMTDATPTGTTFESVATTVGSCITPPVGGTGNVTCTLGSVPNGSKGTITMVVNVNAASGTVLKDKASVSSTTYDAKKGNNAVNVSTTVD
jgi:uncharacterized repeat protein (TIGR01451 family)